MQLSAFATGSVTLAWNASTDPSVVGYNVYYGGASGAYTNEICAGNATNVTVSGLVQGTTYYFAATTFSASGLESPFSSEASYLVPPKVPATNQPPTLNAITNLTINENAGLQTVSLSGITSGATNENLTLTITAVSSNTGLIPNPTVNYTNANTTGKLTFAPVTNANGTATITVTVNDGGTSNNIVTQTFTVTVIAVNQLPTLNAISNLTINENAGLQTVNLSGITSGAANEIQTLTVTAFSSNTNLIPNPTVNYTNANTTGKLTFAPVTNANGTATITVTVNDGGTSNNIVTQTFTVTVIAVNQLPTLNAITNLTINENAGLQTVNLCGITSCAANESQVLTITAASSNSGLIPNPTVNYTNANTTGTLTFTPTVNGNGMAIIKVTVNNGGTSNNIITRTFTVTVNAVNQPPTLNPLNNLIVYEDAKPQKVDLSGITSGAANEKQKLKITAVSDNPGLIHNPKISYTSPHTNGLLTFTPVVKMTGTAAITVTVNDGGASNNLVAQTFSVTVIAPPLPAFDAINDLTLSENAARQTNVVTGISCVATNENPKLKLIVKSSNPSLLHNPSVKYHNPDTTAALIFEPVAKKTGITTITVTLEDGARKINNAFTRTFTITVLSNSVVTPSVAIPTVTGSINTAPADLTAEPVPVTLTSQGYANGQFVLTVAGPPGYRPAISGATSTYVIEASTDLMNWVPVATNTLPFTFVDPDASQFNQRFYRSVYVP